MTLTRTTLSTSLASVALVPVVAASGGGGDGAAAAGSAHRGTSKRRVQHSQRADDECPQSATGPR